MIIKERDKQEHADTDKLAIAGARAEEQMAFYLRRAFIKNPDILVINDLRLKDDTGDVTQIDHFIIHKYGMIIIESKSVTSEVVINKNGEWTRLWYGKHQGMPSPIQQAKRQAEFLKRNLNDHAEQLLDKFLMGLIQKRFGICPFDCIVAISDTGIVKRGIPAPEVIKADLVTDKILAIIEDCKKARYSMNINEDKGVFDLTKTEMDRIASFLVSCHCPFKTEQKAPEVKAPADPDEKYKPKLPPPLPSAIAPADPDEKYKPKSPPLPQPDIHIGSNTGKQEKAQPPHPVICTKCHKPAEITWGKYGYYWKCHACDVNIPIKEFCTICKKKMQLHKSGKLYNIVCEYCKTSRLYHWAE